MVEQAEVEILEDETDLVVEVSGVDTAGEFGGGLGGNGGGDGGGDSEEVLEEDLEVVGSVVELVEDSEEVGSVVDWWTWRRWTWW